MPFSCFAGEANIMENCVQRPTNNPELSGGKFFHFKDPPHPAGYLPRAVARGSALGAVGGWPKAAAAAPQ